MKLTIIGAGSTYTPGLVLRWIETKRDRINFTEICLHDIDRDRLNIVGNFINGMVPGVSVICTTDIEEAITGSAFIVLQIRVGLNAQRRTDEHICVEHGFIGQETTGPGGWILALRQIPEGLKIAKLINTLAPDAWLISVANPAGILGEALIKYGHPKTISMCHGGFYPRKRLATALGVEESRVLFDYIGLNHMSWASRIYLDGNLLPGDKMHDLAAEIYKEWSSNDISMPASFGHEFPPIVSISHYMSYFYMQPEMVEKMHKTQKTRADAVLKIEEECLQYYKEKAGKERVPPAVLADRGGSQERKAEGVYGAIGYSDGCLAIIDALLHQDPQWIIVNVLNEGTISELPDDACVEIPAYVDCTGVNRVVMGKLPIEVRGMIQSVKAYETMTVEAAISGDRRMAFAALLSNPICKNEYTKIKELMEALLESNRKYLPQFFS